MNLKNQKRLASSLLRVGKNKIIFDESKLSEIKEAITKQDMRSLIASKTIKKKITNKHSRGRTRKILIQKRKGRRKNAGSKKGTKNSRTPRKRIWISKVRTQRKFIKTLKTKQLIPAKTFRDLYSKIKSNRFRNVRLIKLYIEENKLINKNDLQKKIQ